MLVKFESFLAVLLCVCAVSSAGEHVVETIAGLDITCGDYKVRITVKRTLFDDRRIPFKSEYVRLGANSAQQDSCRPKQPESGAEMVINVGLQECGTKSIVSK